MSFTEHALPTKELLLGYLVILLCSFVGASQAQCEKDYAVVWSEEVDMDRASQSGSVIVTIKQAGSEVPVESCKEVCLDNHHPDCRSFIYNKVSGQCTLLKEQVPKLVLTESSGFNYLEWSCIYKTTFKMPRYTTLRAAKSSSPSSSTPSTPSTTTTTTAGPKSENTVSEEPDATNRLLLYVILGCSVGGGFLVVLVILILCAWCRSNRKREKKQKEQIEDTDNDMNAIAECGMDNSLNPAPSFYYNHI